jgi:hypothetical protein
VCWSWAAVVHLQKLCSPVVLSIATLIIAALIEATS